MAVVKSVTDKKRESKWNTVKRVNEVVCNPFRVEGKRKKNKINENTFKKQLYGISRIYEQIPIYEHACVCVSKCACVCAIV